MELPALLAVLDLVEAIGVLVYAVALLVQAVLVLLEALRKERISSVSWVVLLLKE